MELVTFRILLIVGLISKAQKTFAISIKLNSVETDDNLFPLSIIHINDFHARFEETSKGGSSCKLNEKCIGGYARAVTVIKELQQTRFNPIYLNAGDNFQGTLWYTLGGWNVTAQFLNMLNADATTLGNHEFDHGIDGMVPFMKHLKSPIIVANIDDSDEPSFQGNYQKTIIIERNNRRIGIIGIILSTTNEIANTENLRFYDESEVVRREATLLREQGVDIVIVLSHCGLDVDYQIAKNTTPLIDVIVGGHTHTFMYTVEPGKTAPGPDLVRDVYPAIVEGQDGHKVLIVQASAYMKYVGDLIVYFDKKGNVAKWEGNPVYLDNNIKQDPEIVAAIQPWKEIIDKKGNEKIGVTKVRLKKQLCYLQECNLGNFIADSFIYYYLTTFSNRESLWNDSVIALVNAGGIRATINSGPITFSDLSMTIPFENSIDVFDLRGDHLKSVFEHAVEGEWNPDKFNLLNFIQLAGAKIVYNVTKEPLNRVVSIDVISIIDNIPRYTPLDPNKLYRCIATSYLADGGDAFHMIPKYRENHKRGLIDTTVIMQYLHDRKIIYTGLENRIKVIQ